MKKLRMPVIVMMVMLMAACGSKESDVPLTPTPEPTATSTPTPEPTATATPTPEPTATATPTPEPTATSTPTPEPTATSTPTPALVTKEEDSYVEGVITESGYENEWLGLRIALPEGVTLTEENAEKEINLELVWEYGVPIVQLMVAEVEEGEETPEKHLEMMKEVFTLVGEMQGITYSFDEEVYSIEIAGQEYLGMFMIAETADGIQVYQDYCVRIQDGYSVSIVFSYADGFTDELQDACNAFSAY